MFEAFLFVIHKDYFNSFLAKSSATDCFWTEVIPEMVFLVIARKLFLIVSKPTSKNFYGLCFDQRLW